MAATITVPAGTAIPLTLVSQVKRKSSKPGDLVRAQVAFPVTTGAQLAIPAGTYVEGEIKSIATKGKHMQNPDLQIHFTRLLFANGYSVPLDANKTQAKLETVVYGPETVASLIQPDAALNLNANVRFRASTASSYAQLQPPPLPPLPSNGPSKGVFIGAAVGGAALLVVTAIIFSHRGAGGDAVLYDAGWQFQMTLQTPVEIPAFQVDSAAKAAH